MKYVLIVLISLLILTVFSCGRGTYTPPQQRSELGLRIASILPQTWVLQESAEEMIIRRQEPITRYSCVGLDVILTRRPDLLKNFVETNGTNGEYRIRLRSVARLDPSEYARLKASNDQIVVTKSTVIPSREYYEEEALRSFDSRYRELPEYYNDSSSIYVETTLHPWECIYPNSVAKECETVRRKLDSLFNRYSKDNNRKMLSYGID